MTVVLPVHRGRADRGATVIAYTLVDASDLAEILPFHWTLDPLGYVVTRTPRPRSKRVWLHRMILGSELGPGLVADHVNRMRLDNRRANLRAVTRAENNQNCDPYANNGSGFRGVSWDRTRRRWRAAAQVGGSWRWLGYFDDPVRAAAAVSAWRVEHMPFSHEEMTA